MLQKRERTDYSNTKICILTSTVIYSCKYCFFGVKDTSNIKMSHHKLCYEENSKEALRWEKR